MILIENIDVFGWESAVRGMRNPMNSWALSDSACRFDDDMGWHYEIGEKDLELMKKLLNGGPVNSKFMRYIIVAMDITAPLYFFKEFDTYKVGTVANSCSTMHKLGEKEFELDDFSHDHLNPTSEKWLKKTIHNMNFWRKYYLKYNKDKDCWWQMIQLLPSSYNQKRTVLVNYENLRNMYYWRKNHKLDEWVEFCKVVEQLPYSELITEVAK